MYIIYIILALVLGFTLGRASKKSIRPSSPEELAGMRSAAHDALSERTEERKDSIIDMMENATERHAELKACGIEAERRGIHREDVEELLGVSDQTALKYLNELEAEGKIRQIGDTGRDVYYMLNS